MFAGSTFGTDFEAVSKFLSVNDEEEELESQRSSAITPASFGAPPSRAAIERLPLPKAPKDPKAIWDEDEVLNNIDDDFDDGRIRPKFEFMYRQAVGTEDAYLGMGEKDPSSTQCEDIVLRVELPGTESMADLDLDVQEAYVRLQSPLYKLVMYLPHKVKSDEGSAKWDKNTEALKITMPRVREELMLEV